MKKNMFGERVKDEKDCPGFLYQFTSSVFLSEDLKKAARLGHEKTQDFLRSKGEKW